MVAEFFLNPRTLVSIGLFLAGLWTYIGLKVLHSHGSVSRVTLEQDYRYCISPEGYQLLIDDSARDKDVALNLAFNFRNVCTSPISINVEEFRLVIGNMTCGEPDDPISLTLPRVAMRTIRSGGFTKDVMKDERVTGTLSVSVIYGPVESPPTRKYKFKSKLQFGFKRNEKGELIVAGVAEEHIKEEDVAI